MKQIKTAELTGAALDWAVAKCEGVKLWPKPQAHGFLEVSWGEEDGCLIYSPSTDWKTGGPIIEREHINISNSLTAHRMAFIYDGLDMVYMIDGQTPLIAAMRCYVASKLGDTVEVPEAIC